MNMNFRKPKFDLTKIMEEIQTEATPSSCTEDGPILDRCEFHHLFVFDEMQQGRRNHDKLIGNDRTCRFVATAFTESHFHLWRRLPDTDPAVDIHQVLEEPELSPEDQKSGWFSLPTKRFQKQVTKPSFQVFQSLLVPLPKHDQRDTTEWSDRNRLKDRFSHWAKIKGELWAIPKSRFREIDEWMYNGKLYKRQRVRLEIPLRTVEVCGNTTKVTRATIEDQEAYMYVGIPEFWEPQIDGGYNFKPVHIYERPDLSRKYYTYTNKEEDSE